MAANNENSSNETKNSDNDETNNGNSIQEILTSAQQSIKENFRQVSKDLERRMSYLLPGKLQPDANPLRRITSGQASCDGETNVSPTRNNLAKLHTGSRITKTDTSDDQNQQKEWGVYKGIIRSRSTVISRIMTDRENCASDVFRESTAMKRTRTLDRTESGAKDEAYFLLAEQELLSAAKVDIRPTLRQSNTSDLREEVVVRIRTASEDGNFLVDGRSEESETSSETSNEALSSYKCDPRPGGLYARQQPSTPQSLSYQTQNSASVFAPILTKQEIFNKAATIIQAAIRKYLARKKIENLHILQTTNVMKHNSAPVAVDSGCSSGTLIERKRSSFFQYLLNRCGFADESQNESSLLFDRHTMSVTNTSTRNEDSEFSNGGDAECENNLTNLPSWDRIVSACPYSRTALLLPHADYSHFFHRNKRHLLYGIEGALSTSESPLQRNSTHSPKLRFPSRSDPVLNEYYAMNTMLSELMETDRREIFQLVANIYNRRTALRNAQCATSDQRLLSITDMNKQVMNAVNAKLTHENIEKQASNDADELIGSPVTMVQAFSRNFPASSASEETENYHYENFSNKYVDEPTENANIDVESKMQLFSALPIHAMGPNSNSANVWNVDGNAKPMLSSEVDFEHEDTNQCQSANGKHHVQHYEIRDPITKEIDMDGDAKNTKQPSAVPPNIGDDAGIENEFFEMIYDLEKEVSIPVKEDWKDRPNTALHVMDEIHHVDERNVTFALMGDEDISLNESEKFGSPVLPDVVDHVITAGSSSPAIHDTNNEVKEKIDIDSVIQVIECTVYRRIDDVDETLDKTTVIEDCNYYATSTGLATNATVTQTIDHETAPMIYDGSQPPSTSCRISGKLSKMEMGTDSTGTEDESFHVFIDLASEIADPTSTDTSEVDPVNDMIEFVALKEDTEVVEDKVSASTSLIQSLKDNKEEMVANTLDPRCDEAEYSGSILNAVDDAVDYSHSYFDEAEPVRPLTETEKKIEAIRHSLISATIDDHDSANETDFMEEDDDSYEMDFFGSQDRDTDMKSERMKFCYEGNCIEEDSDDSYRDESPSALQTNEHVSGFEYVSPYSERYAEDAEYSCSFPLLDTKDDNGICFDKSTHEIEDVKNYINFAELISSMREITEDIARLKMDSRMRMLDARNNLRGNTEVLNYHSSETEEITDEESLNEFQEVEDGEKEIIEAVSGTEGDYHRMYELGQLNPTTITFTDNYVDVTKAEHLKKPLSVIMRGDFSGSDDMKSAISEKLLRKKETMGIKGEEKEENDTKESEKSENDLKLSFSSELDKIASSIGIKNLISNLADDEATVSELEPSASIMFGFENSVSDKKCINTKILDTQNTSDLVESTMLLDGDELSNNTKGTNRKYLMKRPRDILVRNNKDIKWRILLNDPSNTDYKVFLTDLKVPSVFEEYVEVYSSDKGFIFNDYVLSSIFIFSLVFIFFLWFLIRVKFESLPLKIG